MPSGGSPPGRGGNGPGGRKDFIDIFFIDGWKQQSLVNKDGKYQALSSMTMILELLGSLTLVGLATGNPEMALPAIAACLYTAFTLNNSLDSNMHGLMGFLDSPVSELSFKFQRHQPNQTTFLRYS